MIINYSESSPAEGVVISGETVDVTVMFAAQGDLFQQTPIGINDDLVGSENDEVVLFLKMPQLMILNKLC